MLPNPIKSAQGLAKRFGRRTRIDMQKDFLQDIELALCNGKDLCHAVSEAYRYWTFGLTGHRRCSIAPPIFVGLPRENALVAKSPEIYIANKELIEKIWCKVSDKARAAIKANLLGEPYVWRPEIKEELRNAVLAA